MDPVRVQVDHDERSQLAVAAGVVELSRRNGIEFQLRTSPNAVIFLAESVCMSLLRPPLHCVHPLLTAGRLVGRQALAIVSPVASRGAFAQANDPLAVFEDLKSTSG